MGNSNSQVQTQPPHYTKLNVLFQQLATEINNKKTIKQCSFEKYFSVGKSSSLAKLIFRYISFEEVPHGTKDCLDNKNVFVKQMEHMLENGASTSGKLQMYFRIFSNDQQNLTYQELIDMYQHCYQMCVYLEEDESSIDAVEKPSRINMIDVLIQSMMSDTSIPLSIEKCIEWTSEHIPCIFNPIHAWFVTLLLHGQSHLQSCLPVQPLITWLNQSSILLDKSLFWLLSMVLPSYYVPFKYEALYNEDGTEKIIQDKKWDILYNSVSHGQSYNRFKHHCFSYNGPTVILMSIESGPIIVAGIDSNWKESSSSWGKSNCVLLQIQQKLQILHEGENMIFLNEKVRGLPTGMIFGSNYRKPLVSIDTDLMSATLHYKHDTTVHNITRIEVWGCAGLVAKEKQKEQQKWERRQAEKLQKVKLPGQWDENPDRALLEMAGVTKNYSQYGPGD